LAEVRRRIDQWLWFARVTKSRTLAQKLVAGGHVRLNRVKTDNPAHVLRVGDVLTIADEHAVRVLRVLGLGERRGPAVEAAGLYEDLNAPKPPVAEGP
jgi:ribosome-associated heat shock protein Hsp15